MRLILHVGMGKTGTSSIQRALQGNAQTLAAQDALYLGMWFSAIDPKFDGHEGLRAFCDTTPEQQVEYAGIFKQVLAKTAQANGTQTFIMSNEGLFASAPKILPFLNALRGHMDLSLLAYMRDPHQWLPSAFHQWSLRHKTYEGPMRSFSDFAPQLIKQYEAIRIWQGHFSDILDVRLHDKGTDVVADFAQACGITLDLPDVRHLERNEPAETYLRAAFNARLPKGGMPETFERQVYNTRARPIPTFETLMELCFKHDNIDSIVEERRDLFEYIKDNLGFDFLSNPPAPPRQPDEAALQARLIDYLIEITLDQSVRLKRLEKQAHERSKNDGD